MSGAPYRPTIGLTTQTLHSIDGIPPALPESWVMNQRYFLATTMVGGVPWMIPLFDDDLPTLRQIYERLDGLLIPGGVDVDPRQYGEAILPECGNLDPARDRVELQLVKWAIEDGKPVFGLCRGLQIINVARGGSLWQDLAVQRPELAKHDYFPTAGYARQHLAHPVTLEPTSRLAALLDGPNTIMVNSMHHQGIKALGEGLVATATAPDGLTEAIELPGEPFIVGVQWHPEVFEMSDPHTRHLFGGFIAAATRFAERTRSAGTLVGSAQEH
jgi:putative glutamine amidotransferase